MKYSILLICLFLTFVSCNKQKELDSVNPVATANSVKINDAKQWFESNYNNSNSTTSQLNAQKNKVKRKAINWDKAIINTSQDIETVYIPVSYPDEKVLAKQERFRLLITKNKNGGRDASIVHYIANNSYYNKNNHISAKDFTGITVVYDLSDNFIYGLRYNNAKVIGDVTPTVSKNAVKKPSPISSLSTNDCTTVTIVYYSQACSGGSCNSPVAVGSDTYTFCSNVGGSGGGGGLMGGGGGGGGLMGGGGTGGGCGDALICPDGTPNGSVTTTDGSDNGDGTITKPDGSISIVVITSGPKVDPKQENKCFDKSQGATVTVYVQQAVPNTSDLNGGEHGVGHTFIDIEQNGITRYMGYYPETGANNFAVGLGVSYPGELRDNSGEVYDVSITKSVSSSQLASIIIYANNPPNLYNLNVYNCADFGIVVGNLAGMNLPSTTTSAFFGKFNGRSPGELGQDIRRMSPPAGTSINPNGGHAPSKQGTCP